MNRVREFIEAIKKSVEYDKYGHFLTGIVISVILSPFDIFFCVLIGNIVAIGKEVMDHTDSSGQVEFNDYTATAAGCFVGLTISLTLQKMVWFFNYF